MNNKPHGYWKIHTWRKSYETPKRNHLHRGRRNFLSQPFHSGTNRLCSYFRSSCVRFYLFWEFNWFRGVTVTCNNGKTIYFLHARYTCQVNDFQLIPAFNCISYHRLVANIFPEHSGKNIFGSNNVRYPLWVILPFDIRRFIFSIYPFRTSSQTER